MDRSSSANALMERLEGRCLLTGDPYQWQSHPWQDIDLVPGVAATLLDNSNAGFAGVPLGANTFNLYGVTYSGEALRVGVNGLIALTAGHPYIENTDLAAEPIEATIAPLWDFWLTTAADDSAGNDNDVVLYELDAANNRLVIEWSNVSVPTVGPATDRATFHAILQLNTGATPGEIIFNYTDLEVSHPNFNFGKGATVGIKGAGTQGPDRLLVSMNSTALLGNQTALRLFTAPPAGTGSISGVAFHDHDADGVRDTTEGTLDGALIYIDANNNGALDAGEHNVATSTGGQYTIGGLVEGSYVLRQVSPGTFRNHSIEPIAIGAPGASVTDVNFANYATDYTGTFGDDTYLVRRDSTGTKLQIEIGGSLAYTTFVSLAPALTFDLHNGSDTLTIDCVNGNPTLATRISLHGGVNHAFQTDTLNVIGTGGNDAFSVSGGPFGNSGIGVVSDAGASTVDVVNVTGGNGNDQVSLSFTLIGAVAFDPGNGVDQAFFAGTDLSDTIVVGNGSIAGAGRQLSFPGAAPETVTIHGREGYDFIRVEHNPAGTLLRIFGDDGSATAQIGSNLYPGRNVNNVDGTIEVIGGGSGAVTYFDQDNPVAGTTYTLTPTTITRPGSALVTFSGVTAVQLEMANAASHVNVTGTLLGVSTSISMNIGPQSATLGPDIGAFAGPITVYDFGPNDTPDSLLIDDTAAPSTLGRGYTIGHSVITGTNFPTLTYGNLENVTIDGGTGSDTFNVTGVGFNTKLNLRGNDGADSFTVSTLSGGISVDGGNPPNVFDQLTVNGFAQFTQTLTSTAVSDASRTIPYSNLRRMTLNLNAGNDTLNVNSTAAALPVTVNGGDGNDIVSLAVTPMSPIRFNGGLDVADTDTLNVNGGTFTMPPNFSSGTANLQVNVNNAGSEIVLGSTQSMSGLRLGPGTRATMLANGNRYLFTKNLEIDATAVLDLADNDLLWDYTGDSAYSDALTFMLNGRDNPDGAGGIAFASGTGNTVLAVFDNAGYGADQWLGKPIDETTVIGRYTYYGDANLDGQVTSDDYVAVDVNLGVGPGTRQWIHGDFDFDGNVTSDDYVAIDVNLGGGTLMPLATETADALLADAGGKYKFNQKRAIRLETGQRRAFR